MFKHMKKLALATTGRASLCLVTLALSSCAEVDQPDSVDPSVTVDENALAENATKWREQGISHYRFALDLLHLGPTLRKRMPVVIEVQEGAVVSIVDSDGIPIWDSVGQDTLAVSWPHSIGYETFWHRREILEQLVEEEERLRNSPVASAPDTTPTAWRQIPLSITYQYGELVSITDSDGRPVWDPNPLVQDSLFSSWARSFGHQSLADLKVQLENIFEKKDEPEPQSAQESELLQAVSPFATMERLFDEVRFGFRDQDFEFGFYSISYHPAYGFPTWIEVGLPGYTTTDGVQVRLQRWLVTVSDFELIG